MCSNEEFRTAVERQEGEDARRLQDRMQRSLDVTEGSRCGVSQLRTFLESVLRQRYLDSVPQMLPLLDKEFRKVVCVPCVITVLTFLYNLHLYLHTYVPYQETQRRFWKNLR